MKMAAPTASKAASLGCNNKPTFPELDFRSGARVEELNKLIQEFTKHDQREYDDQRALEIHTAKDFIFSMLGCFLYQHFLTWVHGNNSMESMNLNEKKPYLYFH
ncbi:PREDICTED: protein MB21D2-like [Miniopterus natalensis]|uniref:protein MB21D2-like n=1 Tax=Miniopterus natalensis TaxID=291302 RepID=UPI0007A6EBAE|nr:PREDICTED: protein MB21D2-like [Miniopterus natalensis]